ncbi:MAG: CBS domain-containing protein, partial [Pseudomonadota bacterium]
MRAPTNYAGPRRKVPKPKQVSQSLESGLRKEAATVRSVLAAKADEGKGARLISVAKSDSVQHAVERLHEERIGAVLVLDSAGALEGILSERDVVRALPGL